MDIYLIYITLAICAMFFLAGLVLLTAEQVIKACKKAIRVRKLRAIYLKLERKENKKEIIKRWLAWRRKKRLQKKGQKARRKKKK